MSKFNRDYLITMDDIVREGSDILRVVTEPVSIPPTKEDQEEMAAMLQFLKNSQDPEMSKNTSFGPVLDYRLTRLALINGCLRPISPMITDNPGNMPSIIRKLSAIPKR